ncbi:zf-HC2 domain-containing protein [Brevibacillus antibioticus]|uniref:Anti-sigma-W factor RsiW n=1 Tax=Brevibacillus antibioticus TaxID=2570228 RepID=A0A4U2Y1Q0_9BACL|nr:zf-HC2 domain-containing protein [Brevibacillus antibioticus]TKI54277.1 zf-HC2 domain-containing protein [Brevibacillus antibioticus]
MKCADTGFIQAFLDGECSSKESKQFLLHLEYCETCRTQLDELSALDSWTREKMEHAFSETNDGKVNTEAAWQRFSQSIEKTTDTYAQERQMITNRATMRRSWNQMNKQTKRWVTGASAAAVLAVSLSFPQVQAAANDFLSIFRMDKVEFVKVTQEDLREVEQWIASGNWGETELPGIGKIWMDKNDQEKLEQRNHYYNSKEAALKAGVKLPELPKDVTVDSVDVNSPYTMHMEIDADRANKLLGQLQVKARFDEKLNGKRFSLKIPQMQKVWMTAGKESYGYSVVDAPELTAPEGVDLAQLRETLLALPFIPDQVKKQMVSIEDWQHTLPVPYMADGDSKMKEVKVNGQNGMLITGKYNARLMWQQDGQIHMLEGSEKNADGLLDFANQLK